MTDITAAVNRNLEPDAAFARFLEPNHADDIALLDFDAGLAEMERITREAEIAELHAEADAINVKCHRCCGLGRLACYAHIDNGTCFACGGNGTDRDAQAIKASKLRQITALRGY